MPGADDATLDRDAPPNSLQAGGAVGTAASGRPRSGRLVDTVGLDFLSHGGPTSLADPGGAIFWTNGAWADLMVRLSREPNGEPSLPWAADEIVAAARAAGGRVVAREDRVQVAGRPAMLRSHHWVGFDSDGAVVGMACVVDEPSAFERLRRQYAEDHERLEDITRLVSDWVWETDIDLRLTSVSPRVMDVLGFHPRSLVGTRLSDCGRFVAADGVDLANPFDRIAPRPFSDYGYRMLGADGSERQFRLNGLPVFAPESGGFRGYRGTARDVTAEAAALDGLRASERQLGEAIDAVTEGYALFDADERLLLGNRHFADFFPLGKSVIAPGLRFRELIVAAMKHGDLPPGAGAKRLASEPLAERAKLVTQTEIETRDGRWVSVAERLTTAGTIVVVLTDVTEAKRRERALTGAKLAAEAANRAKSEFLANISHELRTPLNAIIGFSELMVGEAMGPIGRPEYKDYLADVLSSGRHLLETINDIIELSKAEAGELELAEEAVEIPRAVDTVLRVVQERAHRGHIRLQRTIERLLPQLWVDPRKLRQILMALLTNAVKFTPPGGTVSIDVLRDRTAGALVFRIVDTGIGIAPADLPTAMKPFGQVDASLNRRYGGAGLGLPLTRALVELHGGTMTLDSRLDEGTTVTVRLPDARLRP